MARLYANENFPRPVVEELRRLGHDVVPIQETGRGETELPDEEVLRYATDDWRAVLMLNRKDFLRLHRENGEHAGIVVCTVDNDFLGQAHRIDDEIGPFQSLNGRLVRVNRPLTN